MKPAPPVTSMRSTSPPLPANPARSGVDAPPPGTAERSTTVIARRVTALASRTES